MRNRGAAEIVPRSNHALPRAAIYVTWTRHLKTLLEAREIEVVFQVKKNMMCKSH